jgi:hypothetical protein
MTETKDKNKSGSCHQDTSYFLMSKNSSNRFDNRIITHVSIVLAFSSSDDVL